MRDNLSTIKQELKKVGINLLLGASNKSPIGMTISVEGTLSKENGLNVGREELGELLSWTNQYHIILMVVPEAETGDPIFLFIHEAYFDQRVKQLLVALEKWTENDLYLQEDAKYLGYLSVWSITINGLKEIPDQLSVEEVVNAWDLLNHYVSELEENFASFFECFDKSNFFKDEDYLSLHWKQHNDVEKLRRLITKPSTKKGE